MDLRDIAIGIGFLVETGVVGVLWKMYQSYKENESAKAEEREKQTQAMNKAMVGLLRNKLRGICLKAEQRKFIYIYEAEDINFMLPAYEALGGNGTTKQMCKAVLDLPHKRKD